MTPDRWARIDQLLDEALERPAAERSVFLDEACLNDPELRREVQSLLAAHQKAEAKFLKLPALDLAAKHLASEKDRSLIGQTISHYSVISVLGVGGMGEVYLARDSKLERKVALKLLPPQYTQDAGRIKRFEREARAASALSHPNIIAIYEIGEVESRHFIAAEYVDGQTLRELLGEGRVAMKDAIEIAIQIASALSAAHEAGIVHRDIKPENVMLRGDGYVKVLDFGLVKLTEKQRSEGATNASEGDLAKTNPGAVLGTARYMSPEQALGQEVDHRSDIFSLGVVLYELLTGLPPFKGDRTGAIMDAIVHYREIPITKVRPDLHPELERIVSRTLEKDREMRYQTANDLRADLKRLQRELDSAEVVPISSSVPAPGSPPIKRKRIWPALAGAASLIAIAVLAWRFLPRNEPPAINWAEAKFTTLTDFPGREGNATISPDGQTIVYGRMVNGQWDLFRQRVGGSTVVNLTNHPQSDGDPAFSPKGDKIALYSARDGGGLYVMEETGENLRRLTDEGRDPDWSPDGREIIYSTLLGGNVFHRNTIGGQLWAVNVETGQKRHIPAGPDAVEPRWSPNGHRIAFWGLRGGAQRDIWTIPAAGGEPVEITNDTNEDGHVVWSPDGRFLYYSSNRNGRLTLWRVAIDERTGQRLGRPEPIPAPSLYSYGLNISRNGKRMVYTSRRETSNIFRRAFNAGNGTVSGDPSQITTSERRTLNMSISADGEWLTYHTFGDPHFDIGVVKTDGTGTRLLTNDGIIDRAPRWSPRKDRIAFFSNRSGKYEIWTIQPDGGDRRQLTFSAPEQPGFLDPSWSPDGLRMLFSYRGSGSVIMDMTRPYQEQQLFALPPSPDDQGEKTWFVAYNWSHDGKRIIGTIWKRTEEIPGLVIYDPEKPPGSQYERITNQGNSAYWLRDNRRLIYYFDNKIWLVDSQSPAKTSRLLLSSPTLALEEAILSSDERWIYYTATSLEEDIWLITLP